MTATRKFRVLAGKHSEGKKVYRRGDVVESTTDLAARFNTPGSLKFEPLDSRGLPLTDRQQAPPEPLAVTDAPSVIDRHNYPESPPIPPTPPVNQQPPPVKNPGLETQGSEEMRRLEKMTEKDILAWVAEEEIDIPSNIKGKDNLLKALRAKLLPVS